MLNKLMALALIIIVSPLYFLIGILIYFTDGFPIIYVQKNYGLNHKVFDLYKFRTMKKNAPEVPTEELKDASGYILKFGKIIRKFSLDELPQFFNVLKGDMNFIGPRPCMEKNEEIIKNLREEKGIDKIKPGITGLAQVEGRDSNNYNKKVQLDYEYMLNKSIFGYKNYIEDFLIVLLPVNIKH